MAGSAAGKGWRCPRCGRTFGRAGQPHSCQPLPSLEDWLAPRSPALTRIVRAVQSELADREPVLLEPTKAALMIKRARTFAEIKPTRTGADLSFILSRRVVDDRVDRTLDLTARRIVHVVRVTDASDIDQQVHAWLVEAWEDSPVDG